MKLEEMQELADAIETIETYGKKMWVRALILFAKAIGWISVGILIECGFLIARAVFK